MPVTDLGGLAYMPGEVWEVQWTPSPVVADSDTVKLVFGGLSITGTVSTGGGLVSFAYTAAQTETLTAYYKYDARVTVNATARTESYDFTTGSSVTGVATYPVEGQPVKVYAGTGIACTPEPITTKGTVSLDAAVNDLSDVQVTSATNGQILKYASGTWSNQDESGGGGGSTALDDLTDVTITSAGADDFLSYSGSAWVNRSIPFMPEPGESNRVRVGKVWNPLLATPALVDVYRRSFYLAAGGAGNPTGDITLISSGVSWCLGGYGYLEAASGVRYSLPQDSPGISGGIRINTDGSLVFKRGAQVDEEDSGYFVAVDIVDS